MTRNSLRFAESGAHTETAMRYALAALALLAALVFCVHLQMQQKYALVLHRGRLFPRIALTEARDPGQVKRLVDEYKSPSGDKGQIPAYLMLTEDPRAIVFVEERAVDESLAAGDRFCAIDALRLSSRPSSIEVLIDAISDPVSDNSIHAAAVLEELLSLERMKVGEEWSDAVRERIRGEWLEWWRMNGSSLRWEPHGERFTAPSAPVQRH